MRKGSRSAAALLASLLIIATLVVAAPVHASQVQRYGQHLQGPDPQGIAAQGARDQRGGEQRGNPNRRAEEVALAGVAVRGTALEVHLTDGRVLGPGELLGAVLDVSDDRGRPLTVRVDGLGLDPRDPEREVVLYRLKTPGEGGTWREFCERDPAGERWALLIAGRWTATGEHLPDPRAFNVTCAAGAIGKCVRLGYKPWKVLADGTSLWDYHQACVRLLRADYCGDGTSFTRAGTLIDLYDRLGIQRADPGMQFEAGWGKDGATCVARARIPAEVTLEELARRCPTRLADRVGAGCTEALRSSVTLLLNKS